MDATLTSRENKRNRVTDSMAGLAHLCRNPTEFLHRYITVDQTWIHFYTPKTKEQSKQRTTPDGQAPKKAKTVKSTGKVMGTSKILLFRQLEIVMIENCWSKCIELQEDHIENKSNPTRNNVILCVFVRTF